jgi:hypothetical protein
MMMEIQVLAWDRHKDMAGLNKLMGSQPSNYFSAKSQRVNWFDPVCSSHLKKNHIFLVFDLGEPQYLQRK